jgi:hypothetical protein
MYIRQIKGTQSSADHGNGDQPVFYVFNRLLRIKTTVPNSKPVNPERMWSIKIIE